MTRSGAGVRGPVVEVPSTDGTIRLGHDVEVDEFVQTYYFERDLTNIVFHAERPLQVYIDTDVWVRPDGALRAATSMPSGSVYTVVSARPRVDAELLRSQRRIEERLTPFGREALSDYLAVPESTTAETWALADQLAAGRESTFDVVVAYQQWLGANVAYDLWAPVARGRRGRGPSLPVRQPPWVLRADRQLAHRDAPHPGCAGAPRHRLRAG